MEHRVAMVEGAAAGILAGKPDRHPFRQQRGKGERLGLAPVDAAPCHDGARRF